MALNKMVNGEVVEMTPEEEAAFLAERVPKLESVRASKIKAANDECDRRIGALVADYPQTEIDTFPKQEQEARAFVADSSAVTPLIDALSSSRGITKADLASRIITKANAFAVYCGQVVGNRQRLEDLLTAATTLEEVQAVDISAGWPE
jgi:hypothetical protein